MQSEQTLHLYSFTFALTMALLFFAHLQRSRRHEEAVARLAVAQAAQREAGRRIVQSRLQAVQARIDPQLLFEMLDAVRRSYAVDPQRAERLLDELTSFLRSALPRLRDRVVQRARARSGWRSTTCNCAAWPRRSWRPARRRADATVPAASASA